MASTCSHVSSCVGRLSASDLTQLLSNMSCDICRRGLGQTNLWLCLYPDCYMMGCADGPDHSTQHNKQNPDHAIQLNVSNKRAWCYLCKCEVVLWNNSPRVQGVLGSKLTDEEEIQDQSMAGLVGLANLGNTCYMNSALQCLSNTQTLTKYFLNCSRLLPTDIKPNLGQAYSKLMLELWQNEGRHEFVAPTAVLHAIKQAWPAFRGFQQHDAQEFLRCFMDQLHKELMEPVVKEEDRKEDESEESNYESADSDGGQQVTGRKRQRKETEQNDKKCVQYRSIVTDIFDGSLQSNVQCLTCNNVSKTKETFQDLSLPIPTSDRINSKYEEGWLSWAWWWLSSWFYGPDVSLMDCLECFFSADELKGDNMYRCEKCKMLRNGLKYSQLTKLPDTMCVHLKRFRHDYSFSSKIGTRVSFPLTGLDLSRWLLTKKSEDTHTYSLTGVICHHGVSGIGGHYTCYCYNPTTDSWYHYDDSSVRLVDASTVASIDSAYVLFYKKDTSPEHHQSRIEVTHGLKKQSDDGVIKSYISTAWLSKFFTMSEPGPIDNSSVICRHGAVIPARAAHVSSLMTPVPSHVWSYLHARYGGSAAVTTLVTCARCEEEERQEAEQKEFELQQFKQLHEEDQSQDSERYCVSAAWFREWEAWVCNKSKEPPGPINNKSLLINRQTGPTLRPNIDHYKFGETIWKFLLTYYGGGPEVVVSTEGGVRVTSPVPPVQARPRIRSLRSEELRLED